MKTTVCLFMLIPKPLLAQVSTIPTGAESAGLGSQSVAGINVFAVQNNPAALALGDNIGVGVYNAICYRQAALMVNGLAIVKPGKYLHAGFGLVQQGNVKFAQQQVTVSLCRLVSRQVSLGININYLGTHIEEQTYKGNLVAALGLMVSPNAKLKIGCFVYNPTQVKYTFNDAAPLPSFVRIGFNYHFFNAIAFGGRDGTPNKWVA